MGEGRNIPRAVYPEVHVDSGVFMSQALGLAARAPPRGRPWQRRRTLAIERLADDSVDPPVVYD